MGEVREGLFFLEKNAYLSVCRSLLFIYDCLTKN